MSQAVLSLLISTLVFFSASAPAMTYTTNFPNTENPISEGANWKNGALDGVDWTNCRTKQGLVFGTENGTNGNQYDDSTCILTGTWGPLQIVQATVFSQNQNDAYFQEVELRLHSTMSAHGCTGYEVLFRVLYPGGYVTIVRWDGPLGKFTYLNQKAESSYKGIQKGDVVKASVDANGLIIGYVNGVEVIRAIDTTYVGGNPGIGFWLKARGGLLRRGQGTGTNADFGFSAFTATDGRKGAVKADRYDKGRWDETISMPRVGSDSGGQMAFCPVRDVNRIVGLQRTLPFRGIPGLQHLQPTYWDIILMGFLRAAPLSGLPHSP
jgi:hypothetical protein